MRSTILIADDEIELLENLQLYLENEYNILQATDAESALQITQYEKPDLVLTDWEFGVGRTTGIEFIKMIRQDTEICKTPVIMVTSRTSSSDLKLAFETGATDYVRKPVTEDNQMELLARVKSAIALHTALQELELEKKKSDELLYKILPKRIVEYQKERGNMPPMQYFSQVSILFTDFQGFTQIASKMSPAILLKELNDCFSAFDDIIDRHNLEKIKTIGDAYMAAGGIPNANKTNPTDAVLAALEIQRFMEKRRAEKTAKGGNYWRCRLGINTGQVTAGVIGDKRFAYDVWGDTVNVASRMESNGEVGKVNISAQTYALVKDLFVCEQRAAIQVKGKGEMTAYFVHQIKPELSVKGEGIVPNEAFELVRKK